MDKKKLKLVIPFMLGVVLLGLFLTLSPKNNNHRILDDVKLISDDSSNDMFAIMLEQNDGTYKQTTDKKWPISGYSYNEEKSGCVNDDGQLIDATLKYNDDNTISLKTNKASLCYLYFDKDVYLVSLSSSSAYFKESAYKTKIKNVYFVDYIDTKEAVKTYDLSDVKNESIMGWIVSTGTDTYDLYIGSKKKIKAKDLSYAFYNMSGLEKIEFNNWLDTSLVTTMYEMFYDCKKLTDVNSLKEWNTSSVKSMKYMFYRTQISDLSSLRDWNVSNVTNMERMFGGTQISELTPIKDWNVSNVTDMNGMFYRTQISDLTPIKDWDVSNVTDMGRSNYTYGGIFAYTQINDLTPIKDWNVSNVTYMGAMFSGIQISDLTPIKDWDVSNVTDMGYIFSSTQISDLTPIKDWDVSSVSKMNAMFYSTKISDTTPLKNWNVSNVENMNYMFYNCKLLTTANLSGWDTSNVTNMSDMFYDSQKITKVDMRKATFTQITSYSYMFRNVPNNIEIIVKEDQIDWVRARLTEAIGASNGTVKSPNTEGN